jgi:hypothetical protein
LNILVDIANACYLVSYSVRDILMLRLFAIVGGILLLPYYYFQPEPLMVPVYWGLAFVLLNLFWVARILMERRPVKLTDDERTLYRLTFRTLTPREMLQLLKLATWQLAEKGEQLVHEGEQSDRLNVLVEGKLDVVLKGRQIYQIPAGSFVGKLNFDSENPAPVSVVAASPVRYVSWQKPQFLEYLQNRPELAASLGLIINDQLSAELAEYLRTGG